MLLTTIFYHVDNFCNEIKKHSRTPTKFIFNVYIDLPSLTLSAIIDF